MTKEEAEAAKAEAEAERIRIENAERHSDLGKAKRDAELRAAIAKADKEAEEARMSRWTSLLPDFSKVERGETKVSGDQALFGSGLALEALQAAGAEAAKAIKRNITQTLGSSVKVLITTDPDLVTSDAAYLETKDGLDELERAAGRLLAPDQRQLLRMVGTFGVGAMLAGALPSVLSLFSAHRTITAQAIPADDLIAATSVAATLAEGDRNATVILDDFRVLKRGKVAEKVAVVRQKRQQLVEKRLQMAAGSAPDTAGDSDVGDDGPDVTGEVIDALVTLIDAYLVALFTVPAGAKRSPYTNAVLREQLHTGEVLHVVLVKGSAGSAHQLVGDRPLWLDDKFSTIASTGVSYLIVDTADGRVRAGGTHSASYSISGDIGDEFKIRKVQRV